MTTPSNISPTEGNFCYNYRCFKVSLTRRCPSIRSLVPAYISFQAIETIAKIQNISVCGIRCWWWKNWPGNCFSGNCAINWTILIQKESSKMELQIKWLSEFVSEYVGTLLVTINWLVFEKSYILISIIWNHLKSCRIFRKLVLKFGH